jgi:hypothetical protein
MIHSSQTSKPQKKLLVFTQGGGRLGNQLINYGHLIAFLLENEARYDFANFAFWEYSHLFENLFNNPLCTLPTLHNRLDKLKFLTLISQRFPQRWVTFVKRNSLNIAIDLINRSSVVQVICVSSHEVANKHNYIYLKPHDFEIGSKESTILLDKTKIAILQGYEIRNWLMFAKHQDAIRDLLLIKSNYLVTGKLFIEKLRKQYNYLVGVFIRQGDFRYYANGRYFFDSTQYLRWIREAKQKFQHLGKVGFIVSSNEVQGDWVFKEPDIYLATGTAGAEGHYIETIAEFSQCDLILTPPSTFGIWPAFIGKVPLLPLCDRSQTIDPQDILHDHIFDAIKHPHMTMALK